MFTRHAMLCRITHNNKMHANASSLTINSYFSECCKKYIFSLLHRVYEKKSIEFSRTSGFSAFRDEWGKIHFRLFLSWLIDRYFNQWKCRLWGVGITWGVNCASHSCSKSPDFLADEGLLILDWFCLAGDRICRKRKRIFKGADFLSNCPRNHLSRLQC